MPPDELDDEETSNIRPRPRTGTVGTGTEFAQIPCMIKEAFKVKIVSHPRVSL